MAILREWRAEIRRELKEEYARYVHATGVTEYRKTRGNLGALVGVRDLDQNRAEIVVLSWWVDREAIAGFAGADIAVARYFPEDDRYLLTRPDAVQHYELSGFAAG